MEGDIGEEPEQPWDEEGTVLLCDGIGTLLAAAMGRCIPAEPEPPCDGDTGMMLWPPIRRAGVHLNLVMVRDLGHNQTKLITSACESRIHPTPLAPPPKPLHTELQCS